MNSNLRDRLTEALDDEYQARATYRKVIEKFGPIRPFINMVEAEERHVAALLSLFGRYGLPVPEDRWPANVTALDTPAEACRCAVEAEKDKDNMALYDRPLAATRGPGCSPGLAESSVRFVQSSSAGLRSMHKGSSD